MLTVSSLLDEFDLDLAVGDVPDSAIRWVHISELEDPTPFLSGGELLLTTGINLKTAARQRKFVRLLAGKDAAGLGLAVGLDHAELPPALIDEAETRGLPLFELPFELPFIAITEWASTRLISLASACSIRRRAASSATSEVLNRVDWQIAFHASRRGIRC